MSLEIVRKGSGLAVKGACVDISFLVLGPIENNTYFISGKDSLIVVDPSCQAKKILDFLGGRTPDAIFATHHHHDHVGALAELREKTGAPVYASAIDARIIENPDLYPSYGGKAKACKVDKRLRDKDKVKVGGMTWQAILTPGHTQGGLCFYLPSEEGDDPSAWNVLVSGDTLFCGSIGRTDFKGGSMPDMQRSLRRLAQLPGRTLVLPGHNALTTIADEQKRVFRYYC